MNEKINVICINNRGNGLQLNLIYQAKPHIFLNIKSYDIFINNKYLGLYSSENFKTVKQFRNNRIEKIL